MFKLKVARLTVWLLKRSWQHVLWRSWRHARASVLIYESLAEHASEPLRREMLLRLAAHARHRGRFKERHLHKVGGGELVYRDPLPAPLWRWVLVRCGIRRSLAWIHLVERVDLLLSLLVVRWTAKSLDRRIKLRGN